MIVAFVAGTQFEERNDGPVENMAESLDGAAEGLENEINEAAEEVEENTSAN